MIRNITVVGALNLDFITEYQPEDEANGKTKDKADIRTFGRDEERRVDDATWWNNFYRYLPGRIHWVTPGGSAANTGAALAAIDPRLSVHVIGLLGKDPEATFLSAKEQWFGAKLQTDSVAGTRTGRAFSYLEPGEGRKIAVAPGCNDHFNKKLFDKVSDNVEWLHASSFANMKANRELSKFLSLVRERYPRTKISVDLGSFLTSPKHIETAVKVLRECDILFAKTSELESLSNVTNAGSDESTRLCAVDILRKKAGTGLSVIVERIPNGYTVYESDSEPRPLEFKGDKISGIVDDTGAGDVFNAGYIYEYLRGLDPKNSTSLIKSVVARHLQSRGRTGFAEFCKATPILFASHSSKDRECVREFIRQFEGTEVSFWLDKDQIPLGGDLVSAMRAGVRSSDFFVLFLTPDSLSSGWVEKEIKWAKEQKLPTIAIRLAKTDIPEAIRKFRFIDAFESGFTSAFEELLDGLRRGPEQRKA